MGSLLFLVFVLPVLGLVYGAIARAIVPGHDVMGLGQTMLLGIVGSYVGGFLGFVLFRADAREGFVQPGGLIGSLVGSVIALLVWRRMRSGRV